MHIIYTKNTENLILYCVYVCVKLPCKIQPKCARLV